MKLKSVRHGLIGMIVLAATAQPAQALELPADAFILLAQAGVEPCAICADKERSKAYEILKRAFISGRVLTTDDGCLLVKPPTGDKQELTLSCYPPPSLMAELSEGAAPPHLIFNFHTPGKHLVGIAADDFTDPLLAETYRTSPPGTRFEGRIRFIAYKYGDGEVFNYFMKDHTLLVHCAIEQIKPVKR